MTTVRELLERGAQRLRQAGLESPRREADLLLGSLLGMSASALLAHDENEVEPDVARRFDAWLDRRAAGEPAAYLLGRREFWGRDFTVDDRVLVPRPESEHLIELALGLRLPPAATVLDVGTGSGCLAVTLAAERPAWRVVAVDYSVAALAVARRNALRHQVLERMELVASDVAAALDLERFDLVVANLPYMRAEEPVALPSPLAFEPPVALYGGQRGLELIGRLCREAHALRAGALLALEIGLDQADALLAALDPAVWEPLLRGRDLAGIERNLLLRRRSAS